MAGAKAVVTRKQTPSQAGLRLWISCLALGFRALGSRGPEISVLELRALHKVLLRVCKLIGFHKIGGPQAPQGIYFD